MLISAALVYFAAHYPAAYPVRFNGRAYTVAVAFEVIAIIIAVKILRRKQQFDLILPVISIIVGVHFFGMVPAIGWTGYWWVGAAMCLWPFSLVMLSARPCWIPMTGLGCAVILWISILCSIRF